MTNCFSKLWVLLGCCAMVAPAAGVSALGALAPAGPVVTADMIEVKTLQVQENIANDQTNPVLVSGDPKGGIWVGWMSGNGACVRHFSDALVPDREAIQIPGFKLAGLYGHEDGSLAMVIGDNSKAVRGYVVFLRKITATGQTIFDTKLCGDEIPGKKEATPGVWVLLDGTSGAIPIAFNGRQYGLFYCIVKNFDNGDCHQADEFLAVSKSGKVDAKSKSTWNASHSFWMSAVATRRGAFYGVTIADPIPFNGVRLGNFSEKPAKQSLIFPRKPCAGTRLSTMFCTAKGLAVAVSTVVPQEVENSKTFDEKKDKNWGRGAFPVLLRFDESGKKAAATYLSPTRIEDLVVSGGRLGSNHSVCLWGHGPPGGDKGGYFGVYPVQMAVLDDAGQMVQPPVEIKAPLTWQSDPTTLANGDLVWAGAANDWTTADDPKKLYLVRIRCQPLSRAAK